MKKNIVYLKIRMPEQEGTRECYFALVRNFKRSKANQFGYGYIPLNYNEHKNLDIWRDYWYKSYKQAKLAYEVELCNILEGYYERAEYQKENNDTLKLEITKLFQQY